MPRDLNGQELVKYLKPYGYIITRQTGSHIRLTTQLNGEHHITVPNHKLLKIGTLASILSEIADHLNSTKELLLQELFG